MPGLDTLIISQMDSLSKDDVLILDRRYFSYLVLYCAKEKGIISFTWFLLHFSITFFFTSRCRYYSMRHSKAVTTLNSKILDTISNIINVRLLRIIIAHRHSTLSRVDRILVFKEGKIVEEGNHDTLLKLNGHYALLWSMQAGGLLPDVLDA